jgi:ubiquinone/menaquinone biosynthesis C-methylase UbiE
MLQKHEEIKDYYGKTLEKSEDLKTNACCTLVEPPQYIKDALSKIHDEVMAKYYGCGLTIPYDMEGLKVLDLGSGSGRDCYIASQLVGQEGQVIGVDMTDEQLDVANRHIDYHTEKFGYKYSNVKFIKGNMEKLDELNLEEGSFDVIISNCVINLAMDKEKVLSDVYKLLKPGGEMYFSDVYSDRRISQELQNDPVLWGECLSGALYWNDFLRISKKVGFTDPRSMKNNPITIENKEVEARCGDIKFFSVTYRLMKIDGLEDECEDFGQAVAYKGGIPNVDSSYDLDDHHNFPIGKIMPVCGNTYLMLEATRFKKYFDFYGTWDTHYGVFEGCGGSMPFSVDGEGSEEGCC